MNQAQSPGELSKFVHRLASVAISGANDAALLGRFLDTRDEVAFAAIVRRHGPAVIGVCQGILACPADAEDAFQATFLVLALRAAIIREPSALREWLIGVAARTSLKARASAARRRRHEAAVPVPVAVHPADPAWSEARAIVRQELAAIPEEHRSPLELFYLGGLTLDQAVDVLGVSKATVRRRLDYGRELLHERLVRRGLGPAVALFVTAWPAATVSASLPPMSVARVVGVARVLTTGQAAASGVIPVRVAALIEGGPKSMMIVHLKLASAVLLAAIVAAGGGLSRTTAPGAEASGPAGLPSKSVAKAPRTDARSATKSGEPSPRAVEASGLLPTTDAPDATKVVQDLIDQYTKDKQEILDRLVNAETEGARAAHRQKLLILGHAYSPRLLALAEKDPASGCGLWALMFLLGNADTAPEADKAAKLFVQHHLGAKGLLVAAPTSCEGFGRSCSPAIETLLRAVLEQPKSQAEAGQACFALGKLLRVRAQVVRELKGQQDGYVSDAAREAVVRVTAPQAKALAEQLCAQDPVKLEAEAERCFERVVKDHGNGKVLVGDRDSTRTLGDLAKAELFELRELTAGKRAPEIEGNDLEGKALKLSDYRGKVVVLAFWGSWCPACMKAVLAEQELTERLAGKPFALVGVNSDADRLVAKEVARDKGMSWRSFWDETPGKSTPNGPIATRWNVGSWPTTYVVDHNGIIRARFTGTPNSKSLDRQLDDLVREAENAVKR